MFSVLYVCSRKGAGAVAVPLHHGMLPPAPPQARIKSRTGLVTTFSASSISILHRLTFILTDIDSSRIIVGAG